MWTACQLFGSERGSLINGISACVLYFSISEGWPGAGSRRSGGWEGEGGVYGGVSENVCLLDLSELVVLSGLVVLHKQRDAGTMECEPGSSVSGVQVCISFPLCEVREISDCPYGVVFENIFCLICMGWRFCTVDSLYGLEAIHKY